MKKFLFLLLLLLSTHQLKAQFMYGTTGLLHMPTATMNRDKTFMFGGSFLNTEATPKHWSYNTYNYYINITIFPWLEIGYTCTLHKALPGNTYFPESVWGKYANQDRSFHGKIRIMSEGKYWKYMPAIVLGANDPSTNDILGNPNKDDYGITGVDATGNGHLNRYYLAMTKHLDFQGVGNLGIHAAYVYNRRIDYPLNGPAVGANFQLALPKDRFINKALNGVNLMAEYDSRTVNVGMGYSLWKNHINFVAELNDCKYLSAGVYFKIHLK